MSEVALDRAALAALGRRLLALGLSERAVLTCFGVRAIAHVARVVAQAPPWSGGSVPPAAVAAWLFCAGRVLDEAVVRARLREDVAVLTALGLLEISGGRARALRALVPIGPSLAVCDGNIDSTGAVLWPDDSTHHLIGALPRTRVGRWLDIGTGSALAPLAARGLASEVRATDVNPRAIAAAELGAALSGAALDLAVADLGAGAGVGWDLVSFNAPIPAEAGVDPDGTSVHRRAPRGADVLARFWSQAPALIEMSGEVVVHSLLDEATRAATADLPGTVVTVRYTTPDHLPFGITVWRPAAAPRRGELDVILTTERPHVTRDDVERAFDLAAPA